MGHFKMCFYMEGGFPQVYSLSAYPQSHTITRTVLAPHPLIRRVAPSKTHHPISPPPATMARPTALPPYEPPYIPLSASHLQKLGALVDGGGRQTALDKLITTLAQAFDTLGVAASDLGELVPIGKDDHDDDQAANQALLDDLDVMARSLVDATRKATLMKAGLATVVAAFREEARDAKRRQRDAPEDAREPPRIAEQAEGVVGRVEDRLKTDLRDYEKLSMVAKCAGPLPLLAELHC